VLGAGAASRLFLNLREEKGYTYGVYSSFAASKFPGPWRAGGDLRTDVTEGAMNEFMKELNRIRDEKVPEKELDEARHAVVAGFALSLEQPTQVLQLAVERKIYGFPVDYWDTYPANIAAVSAADIQRVAQKYIDPQTMQVVAVGDASKIKAVMEKFGPVGVYDAQGKPENSKATPKDKPSTE
jgi:predicted Zn-dependent peptidase